MELTTGPSIDNRLGVVTAWLILPTPRPVPGAAVQAYARQWNRENVERRREYHRQFRKANPDADRNYYLANREGAMERVQRRRNRMRAAQVGEISFALLWETQGDACGLCGDPIDRELRYPDPLSPSIDHIVPLSKGGHHAQANLQWTHLVCNIRKGATVPD